LRSRVQSGGGSTNAQASSGAFVARAVVRGRARGGGGRPRAPRRPGRGGPGLGGPRRRGGRAGGPAPRRGGRVPGGCPWRWGGAVGESSNGPSHASTLVERWNGTSWKIQTSPSPGDQSSFSGVAATSPSNAWAVGASYDTTVHTLIERWNGSSWKVASAPDPG